MYFCKIIFRGQAGKAQARTATMHAKQHREIDKKPLLIEEKNGEQ